MFDGVHYWFFIHIFVYGWGDGCTLETQVHFGLGQLVFWVL